MAHMGPSFGLIGCLRYLVALRRLILRMVGLFVIMEEWISNPQVWID